MSSLAKQLSGQSQAKCYDKGGVGKSSKMPSKAPMKPAAKMPSKKMGMK